MNIKTRRVCERKKLKKQIQKCGGKDSVINSCSSSPLMQHTGINGVNLAGKSARVGHRFLMAPGWH